MAPYRHRWKNGREPVFPQEITSAGHSGSCQTAGEQAAPSEAAGVPAGKAGATTPQSDACKVPPQALLEA